MSPVVYVIAAVLLSFLAYENSPKFRAVVSPVLVKLGFSSCKPTAFSRVDKTEEALSEASGRIISIRYAQVAQGRKIANLKSQALEVHQQHDTLENDLKAVNELLG